MTVVMSLPGSGSDPAGSHVDVDLGPVAPFPQGDAGLDRFFDLFQIFDG